MPLSPEETQLLIDSAGVETPVPGAGAGQDALSRFNTGLEQGLLTPAQKLAGLLGAKYSEQDIAAQRARDLQQPILPTNSQYDNTFLAGAARGLGSAIPDVALSLIPGVGLPSLIAKQGLGTAQDVEDQQRAYDEAVAAGEAPVGERPNMWKEQAKGAATLAAFLGAGKLAAPLLAPALASTPSLLRPVVGAGLHGATNVAADTAIHSVMNGGLPFETPAEFGQAVAGGFAFGVPGGVHQGQAVTKLINKLQPDIAAGKPFSAAELKASGLPTPENYEKINIPNLGEWFIPKKPTVLPNASKTAAELAGSTKSPETETATKEAEAAIEEAPVQPTQAGEVPPAPAVIPEPTGVVPPNAVGGAIPGQFGTASEHLTTTAGSKLAADVLAAADTEAAALPTTEAFTAVDRENIARTQAAKKIRETLNLARSGQVDVAGLARQAGMSANEFITALSKAHAELSTGNDQPGGRNVGSAQDKAYKAANGGWKLHLTVDPSNYAAVDQWLKENHQGQYKLLSGGEPGEKDFTVYVGDKTQAAALAKKAQVEIGDLLQDSKAGPMDTLMAPKVAARFDPGGKWGYRYYGRDGLPYDAKARDLAHQIRLNNSELADLGDSKKDNARRGELQDNIGKLEKLLATKEAAIRADLKAKYGDRFEPEAEPFRNEPSTEVPPVTTEAPPTAPVVRPTVVQPDFQGAYEQSWKRILDAKSDEERRQIADEEQARLQAQSPQAAELLRQRLAQSGMVAGKGPRFAREGERVEPPVLPEGEVPPEGEVKPTGEVPPVTTEAAPNPAPEGWVLVYHGGDADSKAMPWFTEDPAEAAKYGPVKAYYIKATNPAQVSGGFDAATLRAQGHDSARFESPMSKEGNYDGQKPQWVPLDKSQIRPAEYGAGKRGEAEVAGEARKTTEAGKRQTAEERIAEIDKEMDALVEKHGFNEETGELNDTNPTDKARYDAISKERVALFNGDESSLGKTPVTETGDTGVPPSVGEDTQRGAGVSGDEGVSGERGAKPVPEFDPVKSAEDISTRDGLNTPGDYTAEQKRQHDLIDKLAPDQAQKVLDHLRKTQPDVWPSSDSMDRLMRRAKGEDTAPKPKPESIRRKEFGTDELGDLLHVRNPTPEQEARITELRKQTPPSNSFAEFIKGRKNSAVVIGELARRNGPYADIAKWMLQNHGDWLRLASFRAVQGSGGTYRASDHSVRVGSDSNQSVIIHEVGHALTVRELNKYTPSYLSKTGKSYIDAIKKASADPKTPQPVKDLIDIYLHAAKEMGIERQLDSFANKSAQHGGTIKGVPYGMRNLHEFVSEALSKKSFQETLNKIPAPGGGSVWTRIADAIRRIIGAPVKDGSVLERALKAIEGVRESELAPETDGAAEAARHQSEAQTRAGEQKRAEDRARPKTYSEAYKMWQEDVKAGRMGKYEPGEMESLTMDDKEQQLREEYGATGDLKSELAGQTKSTETTTNEEAKQTSTTPDNAGTNVQGEQGAGPGTDAGVATGVKPSAANGEAPRSALSPKEAKELSDNRAEQEAIFAKKKMSQKDWDRVGELQDRADILEKKGGTPVVESAPLGPEELAQRSKHSKETLERANEHVNGTILPRAIKAMEGIIGGKITVLPAKPGKRGFGVNIDKDGNIILYANPNAGAFFRHFDKATDGNTSANVRKILGEEIIHVAQLQGIKNLWDKADPATRGRADEFAYKYIQRVSRGIDAEVARLRGRGENDRADLLEKARQASQDIYNPNGSPLDNWNKVLELDRQLQQIAGSGSISEGFVGRVLKPIHDLVKASFEALKSGLGLAKSGGFGPEFDEFHRTTKRQLLGRDISLKEALPKVTQDALAELNLLHNGVQGGVGKIKPFNLFTSTEEGKQTTFAAPLGVKPEQLRAKRDAALLPYNERPTKDTGRGLPPSEAGGETATQGPPPVEAAAPRAQPRKEEINPGFYSKLADTISRKMPATADVATVKGIIANGGLKAEELKWSGIIPWLEGQKGKVTKEQVQDYLRNEGAVRFEEKTLSDWTHQVKALNDKYVKQYGDYQKWPQEAKDEYGTLAKGAMDATSGTPKFNRPDLVLPGGENYREVVLTVPPNTIAELGVRGHSGAYEVYDKETGQKVSTEAFGTHAAAVEMMKVIKNSLPQSGERFTSSHFPESGNYVAHMRVNERPDSTGKKGTFIEEIQSDRHQKGREQGYAENSKAIEDRITEITKELQSVNSDPGSEKTKALYDERDALLKSQKNPIPDAPYRKDWGVQMFKRALRDAIAKGQDWVGWTKGQTHTDRYGTERIEWAKQPDGTFLVNSKAQHGGHAMGVDLEGEANARNLNPKNSAKVTNVKELEDAIRPSLTEGQKADVLSKKLWDKMQSQESGVSMPRKEGFENFYDTNEFKLGLVDQIGKYVKQWGGKVEEGAIPKEQRNRAAGWDAIDNYGAVEKSFDSHGEATEWMRENQKERPYLKLMPRAERPEIPSTPFHKVAITPEMRASVEETGQPLFNAEYDPQPKKMAEQSKKSFMDKLTEAFKENKYGARLLRRLAPGVRDVEDTIVRTIDGKDAESAKTAGMVRDTLNRELPDKKDQSAAYVVLDNGGGRAGDADSTAAENLAFHRLQEQRAFLEEQMKNARNTPQAQEIQDKIASIEENMARLQEPAPTVDEVKARIQTEIDKGQEALENPDIPEERKKVIRENLPHYQHALDNAERLAPAAKLAKRAYDDAYLLRQSVDPTGAYYQDYAGRLYEYNETRGGAQIPPDSLIGGRSGVQRYNKQRSYDTLMDAMIGRENSQGTWEGETPLSLALPDVVANHVKNSNDFVGNETVKDDLSLVRDPQTNEPILLPKLKPGQEAPANYVKVNGPSGEDTWVYKPFADIFKTVWSPDAMANSDLGRVSGKAASILKHGTVLYDVFHPSRLIQIGFFEALADGKFTAAKDRIHDYVTQVVKPAMLNGEHRAMGKFLAQFNVDARDIDRYVEKGIITKETADYLRGEGKVDMKHMREGGLRPQLFADNLWKEAEPFIRKVLSKVHGEFAVDAQAALNKATFERLAPGMMAAVFKWRRAELARQNPEMSSVQLSRQAAKETNERFGNLGKSGPLKSATANSLAQRILLAPNWVISQAMSEARGVAQFGKAVLDATYGRKMPNGQRERVLRLGNSAKFLATTMGTVFALNQIVNMATRGHPTWQNPEDDHKFDAWLPGGKTGFFYSPTTLAAEYTHHFHNYHKFESAGSAIAHIATNKLSPMGQAAKIALTQKNYKGEKLSTLGTVGEVTKALTPIPISVGSAVQPLNPFASPSKSGQLTNNLARTMGVQLDRAPDAVAQAYDSFKKYSTKEKPDFGPSPYRDLKTLVQNESSPEAIKKEVDRLKANGKKMDDIRKSFTAAFHPSGSVIGDINALQAEPRLTAVLANARKQKAAEREYFFKALQSK